MIRLSHEVTINGRVHDLGYRVEPYSRTNREIIRVKKNLIKKLKRETGRSPLVRIIKRRSRKYWLIKPVKPVQMFL